MTSTKDLAKIKQAQEDLMPETVYIQRLTRVEDGAGGWAETWQTVANVKGRVMPHERQSGEKPQGGQEAAFGEYVITLPADTSLLQTDRLQVSGTQYEIKDIPKRSEQTALRVLCSKL